MSAVLDTLDFIEPIATENQEDYKVRLANINLMRMVIGRQANNRLLNSKFQTIGALDG